VAAEARPVIASWRGVAVVWVIAVVVAVIAALDLGRLGRAPAVVDRAVVPGFDADRVTELAWERAGQPAIRVVRAASGWELRTATGGLPADAAAVGEVLAALRGARWHRQGPVPAVHASLAITAGARRTVLGLGAPIDGTEQAWLAADGRGVVVDRWAQRALDRDALALRIHAPLGDIRRAQAIDVTRGADAFQLAGPAHRRAASGLRVDAALVADLDRALADVAIVRIPDGELHAAGIAVAADFGAGSSARLVVGGGCPGDAALVAVASSAGDGCVAPAAADAVARAVDRLAQPIAAIVERRPAPIDVQRVVLADGAVFETQPLRVAGQPADPARAAELLVALARPAEPAALPKAAPIAHLVVTDRAGEAIALDVFAGGLVARHGEPIALRPAPGAFQLLQRPARALREIALWTEEPTTIAALQIDGVRYRRGAVLGDWSREPAGPVAAARLEALVGVLAAPRAEAGAEADLPIVHRVAITVAPPIGAPSQHVLELGAPRAGGCPARAGRDAVVLPASVCTQVAALAR
jgi:hypothetical protein